MTTHFKLRAYGKINLGLDVLRNGKIATMMCG